MSIWNVKNVNNLENVPYLDQLSFNDYDLSLSLDFFESGKRLIQFESCWSFRVIQEGRAFKTLSKQIFLKEGWLFTTENSNFIEWFNNESEEAYENHFMQYIVITHNEIIEIVTNSDPQIIAL